MTVAQTEEMVDAMLSGAPAPPRKRPLFIAKDVRLFLNTITRSLDLMRSAGVNAQCDRQDSEESITLTSTSRPTGPARRRRSIAGPTRSKGSRRRSWRISAVIAANRQAGFLFSAQVQLAAVVEPCPMVQVQAPAAHMGKEIQILLRERRDVWRKLHRRLPHLLRARGGMFHVKHLDSLPE